MKHVYFMPGMAASPLIFEHIKLPKEDFTIHYLEWLIPDQEESMERYVSRLLKSVKHENPILLGVSFGGVIVQEMAKQIKVEKIILISTVKSNQEFPRRMLFAKKTGIYKILPTSLVENFDTIAKYSFGIAPKKIELYKKYLSVNSSIYLDWAMEKILNWDQEKALPNTIHIHGDADPIFPVKYIKNCIILEEGTHVMIINRFRWFNENLPKLILS